MATDLKTNFLFEFQVLIAKSNAEDWSTDDKEEYSADDDKEVTLSDDDSYQGFTFLNQDVLCSFQDKSSIQRNWILLDSQSTVDVLSNASLLTYIQDAKTDINSTLQCRKSIVTKKGDLKGYRTVLY